MKALDMARSPSLGPSLAWLPARSPVMPANGTERDDAHRFRLIPCASISQIGTFLCLTSRDAFFGPENSTEMAQVARGAKILRLFGRRQLRPRARSRVAMARALLASAWPLSLLLAFAGGVCLAAGETLIAHPGAGVESLSRNEARLYMTMRLNAWPNGRHAQVFVLPDNHPLHEAVAKSVLGLYPYQLRRAWDRQLFSGTGPAPITVTTESEMIERVARTPGAIGYAYSDAVDGSVRRLEVR